MSDTPRTDALLTTIIDRDGAVGPRNAPEEWVTLSRELERENAKLRESELNWAASSNAYAERADKLRVENERLRAELEDIATHPSDSHVYLKVKAQRAICSYTNHRAV